MPPESRIQNKIHELIEATDNPKDKAYLLIMLQMHDILMETSSVTQKISDQMDVHRTEFSAHIAASAEMVNKGKGAWRSATIFLGVLWMMTAGVAKSIYEDFKTAQGEIGLLKTEWVIHKEQHVQRDLLGSFPAREK